MRYLQMNILPSLLLNLLLQDYCGKHKVIMIRSLKMFVAPTQASYFLFLYSKSLQVLLTISLKVSSILPSSKKTEVAWMEQTSTAKENLGLIKNPDLALHIAKTQYFLNPFLFTQKPTL